MTENLISRRSFVRDMAILGGAALFGTASLAAPEEALAYTTKKQTAWCLGAGRFDSVVNNTNYFVTSPSTYGSGNYNSANTIKANGGDLKFNFKTASRISNGNPQSMAIVGAYVYVLFTTEADSVKGHIEKYRLADIKAGKASPIKKGKNFTTGHGQTLSYNPASKELWVIQDVKMGAGTAGIYNTAVRISKKTLTPNAGISFRLKETVAMGHNLTFDSEGNAYFFTYSKAITKSDGKTVGDGKKGAVKIYKGHISTDAVSFDLVAQGLRWAPGTHSQGFGYDPTSNRLVMVTDASIASIPADKLGELQPEDVLATTFNTKREFEAVEFDADGNAYLLSNRPNEILKSTKIPY